MPFPSNLESLLASGYAFLRSEVCPDCGEGVEVFSTPGKREIIMQPMCDALRPAVRHFSVCKPLPASKDGLLKTGYTFLDRITCPRCQRAVERYETPSGAWITLNPMMGNDWPTVIHRCKIALNQEEKGGDQQFRRSEANVEARHGHSDGNRPSQHEGSQGGKPDHDGDSGKRVGGTDVRRTERVLDPVQQEAVRRNEIGNVSGIKLYGVTDQNMIACGWSDGTLAIRFKYGLYHYANVPENIFVTLRKVPWPNNYFTKVVKNHPELYPFTKVG
jgi:hypothetical protein